MLHIVAGRGAGQWHVCCLSCLQVLVCSSIPAKEVACCAWCFLLALAAQVLAALGLSGMPAPSDDSVNPTDGQVRVPRRGTQRDRLATIGIVPSSGGLSPVALLAVLELSERS